jgi:hypothetical protein
MSTLLIVAIVAVVWAFIGVFVVSLCMARGRRYPAPPARPRARLRQSRENVGVVEILPTHWDD